MEQEKQRGTGNSECGIDGNALKPGPHVSVRLRWLVFSRAGGLYAALKPAPVPVSGEEVEAALDCSPGAGWLLPVGHQRPWDALAAGEILSIELRAELTGG